MKKSAIKCKLNNGFITSSDRSYSWRVAPQHCPLPLDPVIKCKAISGLIKKCKFESGLLTKMCKLFSGRVNVLWDAVTTGPRNFGHETITQDDIDQLIRISEKTKSWIVFDNEHGESSIPLDTWREQFKEMVSRRPHILYRRD